MHISYSWLKDFVKLPAKIGPEEVAQRLTAHTVEVEGVAKQAESLDKVVVGRVESVEPHPKADRLRLTVVDIKDGKRPIVCGAPNVAPGQLVAVALPGASLPNGMKIEAAEIRGQESQGMICAEDELGLGADHEGIMVLDKKAKVGESLAKHLGLDDVILEVDNKSLSNRPDLLSHYGLSRELSAIFSAPLVPYERLIAEIPAVSEKTSPLEVKVEDPELCPRYLAVRLEGVKVGESPRWLKDRLVAVNQRPINNIVDLTNYVMLELGQPLHAFDAAKVKKIVVKRARKEESITTLDDKERHLSADDLLITDGRQPLAIAGIMGGQDSQVSENTSAIILEAANFQAVSIRRSSQRLGLRSEASMRFEKSLDPELAEIALRRFIRLLDKVCPDFRIASQVIDIKNYKTDPLYLELDQAWLGRKIGQPIPVKSASASLERLGFKVSAQSKGVWRVEVPSWRSAKDVSSREDLVEEVLRLHGYDNIVSQLPAAVINPPQLDEEWRLARRLQDLLCLKYGLSEAYNYSFVGEDQLAKLGIEHFNYLRLANPLSGIQSLLRQSLVPHLIANIKTNQAREGSFGFFEIGNVFFKAPGRLAREPKSQETLPYQEKHLGLVLAADGGDPLFRLKGIVNNFGQTLIDYGLSLKFLPAENAPGWADGVSAAKLILAGEEIGIVANVSRSAKENINLKKRTAAAEISLPALGLAISSLPRYRFKEPARYPAVIRDVAFVVSEEILYNDLEKEILEFDPLLRSVELFDVYSGQNLPEGKKSLAFRLSYQSDEKTLIAPEVDSLQAKLIERLREKFEAQLRE